MKIERYVPLVGEECEIKLKEYDGSNEWTKCKVLSITAQYIIVSFIFNSEYCYPLSKISIRPLTCHRTLAVEAMMSRSVMGEYWMMAVQSNAVYDAIASGKIPGIYIVERSK
jgi:hypothetical protein